jgi:hypothetical protein
MIIDRFNEFSNAQEVTVSAGSTIVDLGAAGAIEGKPHYLHIKVNDGCTASGSATVAFALQTDNDEAFGSATTLFTKSATAIATLVDGYEVMRLAINGLPLERYLRVYYTVASGPLTAGKFDAFLSADADSNTN